MSSKQVLEISGVLRLPKEFRPQGIWVKRGAEHWDAVKEFAVYIYAAEGGQEDEGDAGGQRQG